MEVDLLDDLRNNKNGEEVLGKLINFYLKLCGVISKSDIEKIIDFYELEISSDEIDNIIDSLELKVINDEYYSVHDDTVVRKIINNRHGLIRLLDYEELLKYCMFIFSVLKELNDVLNNNEKSEKILLLEMATVLFTASDENNMDYKLCELFDIRNDEVEEVINVLNKYDEDIRYWHLYGKNFAESDFDDIINDMSMSDKPSDDSIGSCIDKLSDKGINNLYFVYGTTDRKKLVKLIVDSFLEDVDLTKQEYDLLCDNDILNYHYDDDFFFSGYIYVYEEDNIKHVVVPREIKAELKKINRDDLKDETDDEFRQFNDFFSDEINAMSLVYGYISMNGLIKNSVLMDLLDKRHDMHLSYDELDDIVDSLGLEINDGYYSFDFDDDEINDLIEFKENNDDYKTYNIETIKIEDEFYGALDKFTEDNFKKDKNDVTRIIIEGVKYVAMEEENIKPFCDDLGLSKKEIKKILDFAEPYKNIVPIWIFNGYSVSEKLNLLNNKMGKNMYCPCGSGKDYKDCCGNDEEV